MLVLEESVLYAMLEVASPVSELPSMGQMQMQNKLVICFLIRALHESLSYCSAQPCQKHRRMHSLVKSIDACTCSAERTQLEQLGVHMQSTLAALERSASQ